MRRLRIAAITLILMAGLVVGSAQPAGAHPAFSATWSTFYWTWYGATFCSNGTMYQNRAQMQKWRYWDYNHGFWINHHDHTISTWTAVVGGCNAPA